MPPSYSQPELFHIYRVKKGGKERRIYDPSPELRAEHAAMLKYLYDLEIDMPYATGAVPGHQLIDNVLPHKNKSHFYKVDIKDAFPSVNIDHLLGQLLPLVPEADQKKVKDFITSKTTIKGVAGLPLGLPCSPYLFNIYYRDLDSRIGLFCDLRGLTYTRYLDDLTFSADQPIDRHARSALIKALEQTPGTVINHGKSQRHNLGKGAVTITGVSIYPDRRMQLAPHLVDQAKAVFTLAQQKINQGEPLSLTEIGQVQGWHGTVVSLANPGAPETPTQRWLLKMYNDLGITARRSLGQ